MLYAHIYSTSFNSRTLVHPEPFDRTQDRLVEGCAEKYSHPWFDKLTTNGLDKLTTNGLDKLTTNGLLYSGIPHFKE